MTGLYKTKYKQMISKQAKKEGEGSKETYANGGLILAANCGEKLLMVRVAFSLKEPAKL